MPARDLVSKLPASPEIWTLLDHESSAARYFEPPTSHQAQATFFKVLLSAAESSRKMKVSRRLRKKMAPLVSGIWESVNVWPLLNLKHS